MQGSLYGNFRQLYFTQVYDSAESFLTDYKGIGIPTKITDDNATTLYYLLYARYGNSVVASSDLNQFKYKLFTIIFSNGPTWEKRLEIQDTLRSLSDSDLTTGNTTIFNHAYNPSQTPSTATLDEIPYINEQSAQKAKRGKLDAYAYLWDLLDTDVTTEFLNKFENLFLKIVQPELPLWYVTPINQDEEDEQ